MTSGSSTARVRAVSACDVAWIAAVPCGLALLAAIVVLGPVVGHAFLAPGSETLWPPEALSGNPEPVKHGRFLVALLGPLLLAGAIVLGTRRTRYLRSALVGGVVLTSQALALALVLVALMAQEGIVLHPEPVLWPTFARRTLVVAVALALLLTAGLRSGGAVELVRRLAGRVSATRLRRAACVLLAAAVTAIWLLPAVNSDASVGLAQVSDLPPWAMGDAFAVLDGRTPLVDFHAIYSELWGYGAAVPMAALGASIATFTVTMTAISGLTLLLVYAVFRRIVGSPLLALALYLPFLALGFIVIGTTAANRVSNAAIFSVWPMRYGGPYVLAWLTARHLDGAAPRRTWLLFLAAGLVLINNLEFGLGAFAGTLVAVAVAAAQRPSSRRAWARLAGASVGGLLGAAALVSLLALVRAGALPHFEVLLEFPRIFGLLGLVAEPLPTLGIHLALYVTFVAAIATAVVRLVGGGREPLLTSMLLWSGVFGLGAAGYYLGRSDSFKLAALFSAWGFSLMLLTIVVVRAAVAAPSRRPRPSELIVLLGFALAVCMLGQLPPPWSQAARLREHTPTPLYRQADVVRFVGERTTPREKVAILVPFGHRIAYRLGIENVSPYIMDQAMATRRQWRRLLDAMARERARKLFLSPAPAPAVRRLLAGAGFSQRAAGGRVLEWVRS
jgi:hypothetical protein